jgi:membrane carboxypeptidase/penicillin-binding protein
MDYCYSTRRQYTKNEILAMYCVWLWELFCGVSSAAQTYFSKEPKNLAIEESAILVGFKIQVYTIQYEIL